jgi:hypothetical protein
VVVDILGPGQFVVELLAFLLLLLQSGRDLPELFLEVLPLLGALLAYPEDRLMPLYEGSGLFGNLVELNN